MEQKVTAREKELISAIIAHPNDEGAKVRYEEFLAEARPESVERQLLCLERELVASHGNSAAFDRLVDQYCEFITKHSNYFWEIHRGRSGPLFRLFKVWLVSFHESRRVAVEQAVKLRVRAVVELNHLTAIILASSSPDVARSTRDNFLDFIRRYKGPTGQEPQVQASEITLTITPDWMDCPA